MSAYNFIDLRGQTFGRLTVKRRAPNVGERVFWECICDCGATKAVSRTALRSGATRSCGCLFLENKILQATHGHTKNKTASKEYVAYGAMLSRCRNPKNKEYPNYGGRGIKVCQAWASSFISFLADMGSAPSAEHTLERRNPHKGYSPANCIWATRKDQARNKRNTIRYGGIPLTAWAEHYGLNYKTVITRWKAGDRGQDLFRSRRHATAN